MANDCYKIPQQGTKRPTLQYLNRHVRDSISCKWYDVGIELFDSKGTDKLNTIEANYPSDNEKCCTKMLELWLNKQPSASWNQLIEVLRRPHIDLATLATEIEGMLLPTEPKEACANPTSPNSKVVQKSQPLEVSPNNSMIHSFGLLVEKFHDEFEKHNISLKKAVRLCKYFCRHPEVPFPPTLSSMDDLFYEINKLPYNNCLNLHVLRILADGFDIASLKLSLQNYIRTYSSLRFSKAISNMPGMFQNIQIQMQRGKLTDDQLIDRLIVGRLIDNNADTAAIFDNNTWQLYPPNNCVSKKQEAYYLEIILRKATLYVRVNGKVEFCGSSKDMPLFQCYCFLMQGIRYPALLCSKMKEKGLLSINQLNTILAAPMDYMRNSCICYHIFDMRSYEFFIFWDVLNDHKQSTKGMKLAEDSTDSVVTENEYDAPPPNSDGNSIPLSTEERQHFKLFNKLAYFLDSKSVSVRAVINILNRLKFSKFSSQLIKMFGKCSNIASLLKALFPYSMFYDTSIIKKVLEECCPEALKLLEEVNTGIDWNKCISSYHIPKPSPLMIPDKHSYFTVMATRHHQEIYLLQLKNIALLKSSLLDEFAVPEYACTLIAIGLTICYWLISKSTAEYISLKIPQHHGFFKSNQIEEIAIYSEGVFPVTQVSEHNEKYLWDGHIDKERILLEEISTEFTEEYVQDETSEYQDLAKQLQHVRRQYWSVFDENQKLKQDENILLESLQTWEQMYKKLEKRCEIQEDPERITREEIASKCGELKLALNKVMKTLSRDADKSIIKTEESIVKITTEMQQLKYETNDMQKLIEHLQYYADEVTQNMDLSKQLQIQQTKESEELTTKLDMKDKEITKLKDERKLLLRSRCESRETSKQPEIKVDKDPYPVQYELLGSGNYGEVYKVHYKDKLYAGKVIHSKFLPVELPKGFILKCTLASKFSHPNVEQFVEIARADDKGVPMIITELENENLTAYISRTSDTFHYDLQLSVCSDMAQGLQYLHSQQFVHLNLHATNVLMTPDHHAKIADYLCPLLHTGDSTSNAVYQPPESFQHINVQSNVFTLAVLFLQIITKRFPQLEQCSIDLQGVPSCHPLLVFIQQCLSSDVLARPLMREVCEFLAKLLKDKDNTQMMMFKLIHTTEYPPLLSSLTSGGYELKHITCQNLPAPLYWAYSVTIGMKVYVTGGNSRIGDAVEHVFTFDLENNKWDKLLPPSEYQHSVPVVLEGKLSLIGGRMPRNKTVIGKVKTYDEDKSQWVTIYPDMNKPRYRPAVVTTDSHVIVMGGKIQRYKFNILTDSIEVMSIKVKQWTRVATTLPTKMYDMSATISNNLVWIIGYDDGRKRSNKVFIVPLDDLINLTTTKLSWKQLRSDTICFKIANIVYSEPPVILGGDDRQNKTISAVVVYDPKTESWSEVAKLSSPRANCTVVKLPGERGMLVIGGCTETKSISHCNSSCLSTTEIYYCNKK